MKNSEPKLCPNCPLRRWLPQVKKESWCNIPNNASAVQLCARLRALSQADPSLPKCPHYPKNETLTAYMVKPLFKIGDAVMIKYDPKHRWFVKEVTWFSYMGYYEYILADRKGRERYCGPEAPSSVPEILLKPAESILAVYIKSQ